MSIKVTKIELNPDALSALTVGAIQDLTSQISSAAGEGFAGDVIQGKTRPRGVVKSTSRDAAKRNLKDNTLLKAMGQARV